MSLEASKRSRVSVLKIKNIVFFFVFLPKGTDFFLKKVCHQVLSEKEEQTLLMIQVYILLNQSLSKCSEKITHLVVCRSYNTDEETALNFTIFLIWF